MTNLCLTLAEDSLSGLAAKLSQYNGKVPFIELRLDFLSKPKVPKLPSSTKTQFVATCRPAREGGKYRGAEPDRLDLLRKAAHAGCSWIDVEHDVAAPSELPSSTRVVRSYHCFQSFPRDLRQLFMKVKTTGGDVTKLALSVSRTTELVRLLKFMETLRSTVPHIIIGMGPFGQPSRSLGAFLGNFWTYVSEQDGSAVAPGQFSLSRAIDCYRLSSWTSTPSFYGVLGNPVQHSMSPWLHNRLFRHYNLERIYLPFLLSETDPWFEYINNSELSFQGFSVTLPFKTAAVKAVRTFDSPVNALNTLVRKSSWWEGMNTDYPGFLRPLISRFSVRGTKAVVLGNGGVAHTVVAALQNEGAEVTVVGRNPGKLISFEKQYGCRHALFSEVPIRADLCVNTTPVGQVPDTDASPLRPDQLQFDCVYDLVYHPEETRLLKDAKAKGILTISGMEMFMEQAALQFLAWTGVDPDRQFMRKIIGEFQ